VLSRHLPFELSASQVTLCVVTTMMAGILPISCFNLGWREVVLLGLFNAFGLSAENAVSLSFLFILCYLALVFETLLFWLVAQRTVYIFTDVVASPERRGSSGE